MAIVHHRMRRVAGTAALATLLACGGVPGLGGPGLAPRPALAVEPSEVLDDPALEARARELSKGLRCMVCQNQSIDDSNADLAKDLRVLVRDRLVAGDTDRQVIDYLVSRYGEFVLLKPRFEWRTVALWATPVVVLLAGAGFAAATVVSRRRQNAPAALSPEEEAAIERLARREG